MKKVFAFFIIALLLAPHGVFGEGGGAPGPGHPAAGSASDPPLEGAGRETPKQAESVSGDEHGRERGPHPEGADALPRQGGPRNPVGSRWQIEGGGFIEMGVGRRQ